MRIVGGRHKGRNIVPPKNLRARPTTDFAKENLFNVLNNIVDFEDIDVLDLFSGTGSISYEFASRGARSVRSIEINAVHYNFIKATAEKFGFDNLFPVKANAFLYLKNVAQKFDVIFSDAPYDLKDMDGVVDTVFEKGLLKEDGMLIVEHSKEYDFSRHANFDQVRHYGSVHFSIFRQ